MIAELLTGGAGLVAGGALVWFWHKARQKDLLLAQVEREQQLVSSWQIERSQALAQLTAAQTEAGQLRSLLETAGSERHGLQSRVEAQGQELVRLQVERQHLQTHLQEQQEQLRQLNQQLSESFRNVASQILEEKSQRFTRQNQENLGQLLHPLKNQIEEFRKRIEDIHTQDVAQSATLGSELKRIQEINQRMSVEAENLSKALVGQSKVLGDWGEMVLETILEKAGLVLGTHYRTQTSFADSEGRQKRPDVIIDLPEGNKHLIIDSKVSLAAYVKACNAPDETVRQQALREHVAAVRQHVNELSAKNYSQLYQIHSPDFVLMFIPIEPAFHEALQTDRLLFQDAFQKNIVLVSSSTLLATLWTVGNIWRQDKQRQNALVIAHKAGELCDRIVELYSEVQTLGQRLRQADEAYQDILKRLKDGRGNLARRALELKQHGARMQKKGAEDFEEAAQAELPEPGAN